MVGGTCLRHGGKIVGGIGAGGGAVADHVGIELSGGKSEPLLRLR
jgi:hypothetical protein